MTEKCILLEKLISTHKTHTPSLSKVGWLVKPIFVMQATWGLSYFRESESPQFGILFGAPRHIAGGPFLRSARLRRAESCVPTAHNIITVVGPACGCVCC